MYSDFQYFKLYFCFLKSKSTFLIIIGINYLFAS
ncbi:hypothetical protein ZPR_0096 [Zunongwangia profunda SM-A87]|uniref:Uncharacterized protein n=1 Tax=Zunongwangia profunda (strain DSM 18752 / CCTCC AB 206139 / SM-A87) TaxID=655815 RepID=D5BBM6_ZUNPS|nr:hypothetical protein ZPR_0096 [Zunongwangia profunda SM-A87]